VTQCIRARLTVCAKKGMGKETERKVAPSGAVHTRVTYSLREGRYGKATEWKAAQNSEVHTRVTYRLREER
jgi:hypothetical protein